LIKIGTKTLLNLELIGKFVLSPQYLITGARNPMDWSLWDKPGYGRAWSLKYNDWSQTQYMYISGGFFMIKRHVMIEEPLE